MASVREILCKYVRDRRKMRKPAGCRTWGVPMRLSAICVNLSTRDSPSSHTTLHLRVCYSVSVNVILQQLLTSNTPFERLGQAVLVTIDLEDLDGFVAGACG